MHNITSTLKDQRSFCDPGLTLNSPGTASKPVWIMCSKSERREISGHSFFCLFSSLQKKQGKVHKSRTLLYLQTYLAIYWALNSYKGFSGGSDSKDSASNVGDSHPIPGSGRFPEVENGYSLQYSCLENSMDRGAWQAPTDAKDSLLHKCIYRAQCGTWMLNPWLKA